MLTRRQLVETGLDDALIARQWRSGRLDRVRHGVYDDPTELTPEARHRRLITATMPLVASDSTLSHHSAGVLHGLPVERNSLDRVALTRRGSNGTLTSGGVVVHRRAAVPTTRIDGLRVTTLAQTAVDLACRASHAQAVAVMDAALRLGTPRADLVLLLRGRRRRGNPRAREALSFADGRSESAGESHCRVVLAVIGYPPPELQWVLHDATGDMRLDFAWPDHKVVVEFDGLIKYDAPFTPGDRASDVVVAERRRQARIEALGWRVIRFTWADLRDRVACAARLRTVLG